MYTPVTRDGRGRDGYRYPLSNTVADSSSVTSQLTPPRGILNGLVYSLKLGIFGSLARKDMSVVGGQ